MSVMRTAAETAEQVRKGALKATDRIKEALDAIEKHNGAINAFIRVDAEGALARAHEIDQAVAAGEDPGPLAGVPLGVKDMDCLLYTSPSPRDLSTSRMPSSA